MTDKMLRALRAVQMRKRAAAVLTPEAEQAALQPQGGGMPPQGMDPSMAGGMPPQGADPAMMAGGMPPQGMPPQVGAQLPPEILQDQGFIEFMAQQGAQLDPQSGMFIDMQSGQPVPPEIVMQAYQTYMQQMQGGGMPPQGMDPAMAGGQPPMGGAGQLPPEILQDQTFIQFLTEQFGIQVDQQSGTLFDPQSGQPVPPDLVMQAYQTFQQQMSQMPQGVMDGSQTAEQATPQGEMDKLVEDVVKRYSAGLEKKIETLMDKVDTLKQLLEAVRDTDDARTKADVDETRDLQAQLEAELSAPPAPQGKTAAARGPKPINMFDILARR